MANESDIKLKLGVDTKDAESAISTFSKTADKAFSSSDRKVQQMGVSLDRVVGKMKNTKAELDRMNNTKVPTDTYKNLEGTIKSLGKELKITQSEADRLWRTKVETAQYLEAKNRVTDLKQAIKDTQQTLKTYDKSSALTDQFREAQKEVDKLQRKVAQQTNLTESMAMKGDMSSIDYTNALNQLNDYEYALRDARNYMQELINQGQQFKDQVGFNQATADVQRFEQQLSIAENEMKLLEANGQQWDLTAFDNATTRAQELEQELQLTKQALYMLIRSGGDLQLLSEADPETARRLAGEFESAGRQASVMQRGIEEASASTTRLGRVIGLLKSAWSKVTNSVRNYKSNIRSTESMHNMSFKKMLTSVLKYVFGIRSIFLAYKKMRQVIKEGMKSLAKQFPEIATQVNALNNAWWGFKSSIVSAFQPIFSYVVPALVTLINYLTSAMNTLANFFAVLTGQGYYYKAVKGNKDVAKSVGGTGSAAKKANEELAEYDKLLVIDQKDSGGGGGGGGAGSDDDGFNWVKEQTETNDFIESLKKAWAEGDYEGLGRIISQKLTDMMNNIPWDSIYAKAKDFGVNLASFLNGLINPELFTALGTTIANALKTALIFLQNFGETFDWENLGNSIASGINAFFANFQFSQLAETFNTWANGLLTALITAIQGIDFKAIAQNIADGIGAIDAKGIMWKVGTLVTSLAQAVTDFAGNNALWANLGTKMAEGINGFLKGFDIGKALTALGTVAAGMINTLATFVQKTDWDQVGATLIQGLTGIFTKIPWDKVVGGIGSLLLASIKSQFTFTLGMAEEITSGLAEWFKSIGLDSVAGFFEGLSEKIKTAKEFIKGTFDLIIQWVKDFFGIASPSTVFAEIGGFLIEGLKNGISTAVSAIGAWIKENVVDKITGAMDAVKEIFVTAKGVVDNTFTNLQQAWDAFKDKLATLTGEAKEKVAGAISALKAGWDSVVDKTATLVGEAKEKVSGALNTLKTGWTAIANKSAELTANAKEKAGSALSTIQSAWTSLVDKSVEASVSLIKNGWTKVSDWVNKSLGGAVNKAVGLAKDGWSTVKAYVDDKTGGAVSKGVQLVKDGWTSVKSWIGDTGKAISQGIALAKSGWKSLSSWIGIVGGKTGLSQKIALAKSGWRSLLGFLNGTPLKALHSLTCTVGVKLQQIGQGIKNIIGGKKTSHSTGGKKKAKGGVFSHGTWHAIPQYANGTLNAGSLFIAGEAGPEIVGNVKGRTEVLNASQIASAIRTAVIDGMTAVLNKVQGLNLNLNLSALSNIPPIPVIVTGQLLPLTEAFMFKFEEQHKDFEDVKLRLDDIIRRLSDGSNKEPIVLQLDGRTIVQLVWDETQKRYKQTGKTMFA